MKESTLQSLKRMRQYSQKVLRLKIILLGSGLLLILLLLILPQITKNDRRFEYIEPQKAAERVASAVDNQMIRPRFSEITASSLPPYVQAESAVRRDDGVIVLTKVTADISINDKQRTMVIAQQGLVWLDKQKLQLSGDVDIFLTDGTELRSNWLEIDLPKKIAYSQKPVVIQSSFGVLNAQGFIVYKEPHQRIEFKGPVNLKVYLKPKR